MRKKERQLAVRRIRRIPGEILGLRLVADVQETLGRPEGFRKAVARIILTRRYLIGAQVDEFSRLAKQVGMTDALGELAKLTGWKRSSVEQHRAFYRLLARDRARLREFIGTGLSWREARNQLTQLRQAPAIRNRGITLHTKRTPGSASKSRH